MKKLDADDIRNICELRSEGASYADIAESIGKSATLSDAIGKSNGEVVKEITEKDINEDFEDSFSALYRVLLDFKAKHGLTSIVEEQRGLVFDYIIEPSLPEDVVDEVSELVDDMIYDVQVNLGHDGIKYGNFFGCVSNKV